MSLQRSNPTWCAWSRPGDTRRRPQPELIAKRLGLTHHRFEGGWEVEDWTSGIGVVSRWPTTEPTRRPLRDESGRRAGMMMIFDVEDHAAAQALVESSPYLKAGLYEDHKLYEYQSEIG